jgi:uncharacterized protein YbjT (DUF2867 family)
MDKKSTRILVTGATGYVGGRLVPELVLKGYQVRSVARNPRKLLKHHWEDVEVIKGDMLDYQSLLPALEGVDIAFYLVHSMTTSGSDFEKQDWKAASNFAKAAKQCGVKRIIYLGGLGSSKGDLSKHLKSRQSTGEALRSTGIPVTEFRSAIVVGSGGASFQIMKDLVSRIPLMICPRWVQSRCEPISIRQLLQFLLGAIEEQRTSGKILEIGNGEVLTYGEMLKTCAAVMGKKIYIIPVPVLTPRLSSYWLNLVTNVPFSLARPLVESLKNDVVCENKEADLLIETEALTFKQSLTLALAKENSNQIVSRWTDATTSALFSKQPTEGSPSFVDRYETRVKTSPEKLYKTFCRVGGKFGWFHANRLWRLRALLDHLIGGVGMRRGRPKSTSLEVGDPVDFWRVEEVTKNESLVLRAEMKLPGVARLIFEAKPADEESILTMTARYWPEGFWGRVYWYTVLPLHNYVFGGMIKCIAEEAQSVK